MGTTAKALTLLDCFDRARPVLGLSDLARLSGINKATCFRLMAELIGHGLAEQAPASREYRIGPAVLRLAQLREATVPARDAAMPVVTALARASGETAHLSLLVGDALHTLGFAYPPQHAIRAMMDDADILPFHATASGAAVLAWLPDDRVARILAQPQRGATAVTAADIRARMAGMARLGWAETLSTFERDVQGFAVPLFDGQEACVGALAVAAAVSRVTPDLRSIITAELARSGADITRLWGGAVPLPLQTRWATTP